MKRRLIRAAAALAIVLAAADFVRYVVDSLIPTDCLSPVNYARIKFGMSAEEVEGILGEADQVCDMYSDTNPGSQIQRTWMAGRSRIEIIFKRDTGAVIGRRWGALELERPRLWERVRERIGL
jgi:hypothetical protein